MPGLEPVPVVGSGPESCVGPLGEVQVRREQLVVAVAEQLVRRVERTAPPAPLVAAVQQRTRVDVARAGVAHVTVALERHVVAATAVAEHAPIDRRIDHRRESLAGQRPQVFRPHRHGQQPVAELLRIHVPLGHQPELVEHQVHRSDRELVTQRALEHERTIGPGRQSRPDHPERHPRRRRGVLQNDVLLHRVRRDCVLEVDTRPHIRIADRLHAVLRDKPGCHSTSVHRHEPDAVSTHRQLDNATLRRAGRETRTPVVGNGLVSRRLLPRRRGTVRNQRGVDGDPVPIGRLVEAWRTVLPQRVRAVLVLRDGRGRGSSFRQFALGSVLRTRQRADSIRVTSGK